MKGPLCLLTEFQSILDLLAFGCKNGEQISYRMDFEINLVFSSKILKTETIAFISLVRTVGRKFPLLKSKTSA